MTTKARRLRQRALAMDRIAATQRDPDEQRRWRGKGADFIREAHKLEKDQGS